MSFDNGRVQVDQVEPTDQPHTIVEVEFSCKNSSGPVLAAISDDRAHDDDVNNNHA
jgi:hypothetical protein